MFAKSNAVYTNQTDTIEIQTMRIDVGVALVNFLKKAVK
jgi:hypothetical protein